MNQKQIDEIVKWQNETFGDLGTALPKVCHLEQEVKELKQSVELEWPVGDIAMEIADCLILIFGIAAQYKMDFRLLESAVALKMLQNKSREWGDPDGNGVVNHMEANGIAGNREFKMDFFIANPEHLQRIAEMEALGKAASELNASISKMIQSMDEVKKKHVLIPEEEKVIGEQEKTNPGFSETILNMIKNGRQTHNFRKGDIVYCDFELAEVMNVSRGTVTDLKYSDGATRSGANIYERCFSVNLETIYISEHFWKKWIQLIEAGKGKMVNYTELLKYFSALWVTACANRSDSVRVREILHGLDEFYDGACKIIAGCSDNEPLNGILILKEQNRKGK